MHGSKAVAAPTALPASCSPSLKRNRWRYSVPSPVAPQLAISDQAHGRVCSSSSGMPCHLSHPTLLDAANAVVDAVSVEFTPLVPALPQPSNHPMSSGRRNETSRASTQWLGG